MPFSLACEERLKGVHPHLVAVVRTAAVAPRLTEKFELRVLDGVRTLDRQAKLVASGASRTMRSRHLTGHAVDLGPWLDGALRWDWPLFHVIGEVIKAAAITHGVALTWGGDWKSFPDGPHFELDWAAYPADG